jgi:hypothetical protein
MQDSFREIRVIAVLLCSNAVAYDKVENVEPQLCWKGIILHPPSDVLTRLGHGRGQVDSEDYLVSKGCGCRLSDAGTKALPELLEMAPIPMASLFGSMAFFYLT